MTQQEIQNLLMKEREDVYLSTGRIEKLLGNANGLISMRNYGEVETVKVKTEESHIVVNCHRLTKKGRGS